MHSLRAFLPFVLLVSTIGACAQVRMEAPKLVRLRLMITFEDGREKVPYATVELLDAVGYGSATDRKETDQEGRVEFKTLTGLHRFIITGPGVRRQEGEFEIQSNESFHMEVIRVRREQSGVKLESAGTEIVPSVRLKVPADAHKDFEKGSDDMQKRRWANARKHFEAAIAIYPEYDLAYNGLGVAANQMNDVESARKAFAKAIELNDKFAEAQRNLARILIADKNYGDAAKLLERSLESEPNHAWALTNAAYAELQVKKFGEAVEHARRAHSLPHEGLANAHVIAAYALEALSREEEAKAEFRLYLQEDPNGPNVKRVQAELAKLQAGQK